MLRLFCLFKKANRLILAKLLSLCCPLHVGHYVAYQDRAAATEVRYSSISALQASEISDKWDSSLERDREPILHLPPQIGFLKEEAQPLIPYKQNARQRGNLLRCCTSRGRHFQKALLNS